jgi:exopolysaccharide biosynthesis protein
MAPGRIVAVACDGRSRRDAGLTLVELAKLMAALGCEHALNLDGGGSTALVSGGRLQNLPRRDFEEPEPGGRPVSTALEFRPSGAFR